MTAQSIIDLYTTTIYGIEYVGKIFHEYVRNIDSISITFAFNVCFIRTVYGLFATTKNNKLS